MSLSPSKCSETSTKKRLQVATLWMGPAGTMWVCPPGAFRQIGALPRKHRTCAVCQYLLVHEVSKFFKISGEVEQEDRYQELLPQLWYSGG